MTSLDNDQKDSFAMFLPAENLIKWHMKTQGATFNDIVIIYDVIKDSFLVDNQKYFFDGVVFLNKVYTVSMIEEKVFQDEYSNDDQGV